MSDQFCPKCGSKEFRALESYPAQNGCGLCHHRWTDTVHAHAVKTIERKSYSQPERDYSGAPVTMSQTREPIEWPRGDYEAHAFLGYNI